MAAYVSFVALPRYTALSGASEFTTSGVQVDDYANAILNVWHSVPIGGGTPGCAFTCEESTDGYEWTTCAGTTEEYDPGDETEGQIVAQLKKRWFRLRVTVVGAGPSVSCWAVGSLEQR
jgi:hypothetical protein